MEGPRRERALRTGAERAGIKASVGDKAAARVPQVALGQPVSFVLQRSPYAVGNASLPAGTPSQRQWGQGLENPGLAGSVGLSLQ